MHNVNLSSFIILKTGLKIHKSQRIDRIKQNENNFINMIEIIFL